MTERTPENHKSIRTWVLVADAKQAQIYKYHRTKQRPPLTGANRQNYYDDQSGYELEPLPHGTMAAESMDDHQIGHDQRGTSSNSNSPVRNTYEPHGDIKEELKRRFARTIADKLEDSCKEKLFDRLVLVAPAKIIGELRKQLSADVESHISAVLSKDFAHDQPEELFQHLQDTLDKAQVA